jgi:hypothetical protein
LPDLGENIKCGNSLIGPDYFEGQLMPDEEEMRRVNPFDWEKEFPEIMEAGGFDAVIGNPPYVRIQTMKEWAPTEVEFYKEAYTAASKGNYDIYVVFVQRALQLLNDKGRMGYILPHKFFQAQYGQPLRELIATGNHLGEIVHFGDEQVFAGASTYTCLLFLDKGGNKTFRYVQVEDLASWRLGGEETEGTVSATVANQNEWTFVTGPGGALFQRLADMPRKLEHVTERIFQGLKTGADQIYILEELERDRRLVRVFSRATGRDYRLEDGLLHPLVKGGDSKAYCLAETARLILFPYTSHNSGQIQLLSESRVRSDYPHAWAYLAENRDYLENREHGKMRGEGWYGYTRNQALDVISRPKIFTPDIALRASFSLDEVGDVFFTGGVAGGYGILVRPEESRDYVLGLLNSKLLDWFIRQSATQMRGGYFSYESRFIRRLPIRTVNFDDAHDVAQQDRMVALVQRMLDLHKKLAAATIPAEKKLYQRQIESTDQEIDELVYELYGLTREEIAIVEQARQ